MLRPADAARLGEAFRLLQQGRPGDAARIADDVASRVAGSADVLHMQALCRKALGDEPGALERFDAALAIAPGDPNLLGNSANLLCRCGRYEEAIARYRRLLDLAPGHADGWLNFGLARLATGDSAAACDALERAVAIRPEQSAYWQALGSARRGAGRLDAAETALRRAVELDAANGAAWTALGVLRRLLGDPLDALACYREARRAGFTGVELDDAEASAELDAGNPVRAHELAAALVRRAPGYVPGQTLLAHLRWEHGRRIAPGVDALAALREAVAAEPGNRPLALASVRFHLEAGATTEALAAIRALRRREDSPALAGMEADALDALGETVAAARQFAAAWPALAEDAAFLNLYARHLLRHGRPDEAADRAGEALSVAPHDQLALALLGVAWRLLGDPREDWLCGYDRYVAELTVEAPPGYADMAAFLDTLAATLNALHTADREPVNQSLRGGTQTAGVLFGRRDPVIAALRDTLARSVDRYLADLADLPGHPQLPGQQSGHPQLPEQSAKQSGHPQLPGQQSGQPFLSGHPFLARRTGRFRFAGSWSVRLASAGRHANHYHQEGWISSAFYVALPPAVGAAGPGDTAGCLQLGQPPVELGLDLPPRRVIRPRAGRLVLFPSYLWHGTVPFQDDAARLTVAFDAVPVPRDAR